VGPLLATQLESIKEYLRGVLPERQRLTTLEEAVYDGDLGADGGFEREMVMQGLLILTWLIGGWMYNCLRSLA
jgi:hypothetical protein